MDGITHGLATIEAVITHACGCVADHGTIAADHGDDPHHPRVREILLARLTEHHVLDDVGAHLAHAATLTNDELRAYLDTTIRHLFQPKLVARCDGSACTRQALNVGGA